MKNPENLRIQQFTFNHLNHTMVHDDVSTSTDKMFSKQHWKKDTRLMLART